MHYGNRLETRRPTYPSRSPLPTRSTSILKLNECQHFHYDYVELGPVTVQLVTGESELLNETNFDPNVFHWTFSIESNNRKWMIHKTFPEFTEFDCQLHRCVFDRRHSRLTELRQLRIASISNSNISSPLSPTSTSTAIVGNNSMDSPPSPTGSSTASTNATTTTAALSWAVSSPIKIRCHLATYVDRLSQLTGSIITCFPVLKFLELDSRGNRFVPIEQSQINTPAIAAAIVVREFEATKPNELSIKVGDIVSVIEMKTLDQSDNIYWKGKLTISKSCHSALRGSRTSLPSEDAALQNHHFVIGYFPSSCVKLFSGKIESEAYSSPFSSRPFHSRSFINRQNIWKMRPKVLRTSFWSTPRDHKVVFGIDLVEYLSKTNHEVPLVLTKCINVIETHGLITGIYRQCGIQSNIRRLRWEFDNGNSPDLTDQKILRDIHCVSSLLKQYFRQLPNPLFTYELYGDILEAYESDPKERIGNVRKVVRQLPPAHYRTARTLMYHLSRMCRHKNMTDMNASNLAIVWGPNLFRGPPTDGDFDGQLLRGITINKSLCNFFIVYANEIFTDNERIVNSHGLTNEDEVAAEMNSYTRHKEDFTKNHKIPLNRPYIDVNGGPAMLPSAFHTVIELPHGKNDTPKWKRLLRYSSLEHSLSDFWNRRRSAKSSTATQNTLADIPMTSSVTIESGNMRRSASMLSYVTKNVEDLGQNVIRHVRNISLRRSRRGRPEQPSHTNTTSITNDKIDFESNPMTNDDFEILKPSQQLWESQIMPGLRMTQSIEGNAMFNGTESKSTTLENNNLLNYSKNEQNSNNDSIKIVEKVADAKQKRVMFESSSRAEQIFYAVDDPTDYNSDDDEADKHSTDISSAESLPLDVSRYDNVAPQKNTNTFPRIGASTIPTRPIASPPSVYDDVKNTIVLVPNMDSPQ